MNKVKYQLNELCDSHITPNQFDYLLLSLDNGEQRSWTALLELYQRKVKIRKLIIVSFDIEAKTIKQFIQKNRWVEDYCIIRGDKANYLEMCIKYDRKWQILKARI